MKALNINTMKRAKQAGFTIIELVVVILLLGILTATALPRFLDISDDAHGAVVNAVEGSLRSGLALYRAGYVAKGQTLNEAVASFGAGTLWPDDNGTGFPADATDGAIAADAVDCLAVFNGLLDLGGIVAAGVAAPDTSAVTETAIETAATSTTDFVVTPNDATTPTGCFFYYVGQFKSGTALAPQNIRRLEYTLATGTITQITNHALDQA